MGARIVRHTENHAYSHSPDHWTVEYVKRGNIVSRSGDRAMQASDGSLILRSLAHPYVATSDDTDTMAVHLDRDSFPKLADWLDRANHTQITGTFGALFKDFMLSLEAHLPTFTLADIPVINASLAALVRSLVLGSPQYSLNEHPLIEAAMFNRARNYIEANIRSPHLSPDTTARALGMSSRKLYYLFEKRGGVANYIRHRRLAACHRALTDISEFRSIREIAEQFGLGNRSLFNRQFRGRYGYGPSEAREATLLGYASNPSVPKFLWVD